MRDSVVSGASPSPGDAESRPEAPDEPDEPIEGAEWLGRLTAEPEPERPPEAEEEEVPDWLAELAPAEEEAELPPAEEEAAEPTPADVAEPAAEEVPSWLAELAPAEEEAELPPAEEEVAEPTPPDVAEPAAEEVPDWLAQMVPAEEEPTAPPEEAEVPDWLAELAPAEEEAELPPPEEEVAEPTPADVAEPAAEEVPDWLAQMAPAEEEPTAPPEETQVPDWLTELAPAEAAAELPPPEEEVAEPAAEAKVPDWLAQMAPAEEAAVTTPSEVAEPPAKAETPPQIEEVSPAAEPEAIELEAVGEVPDWLTELKPPEAEAPPPESDLAQAEIPAWLKEMQPSAAPAPAQEEELEVETQGWLAGIAGIVPAASAITTPLKDVSKPEPMSAEATMTRARLWQELIARSAQPAPVKLPKARRQRARDRVERWFVYGIVFLAVFVPIFTGIDLSTVLPLNEPLTPQAVAAFDFIDQTVTEDTPVLIAFDYTPSFLGELHLQAEGLLHHLARKGARVMALSLTPEGAGLAQQLFDDVLEENGYQAGQDYVNLGFLPGEAAGIRSLEFLPRQFQGQAFDGRELQDAPIWDGDASFALSKVSLVIVLTGDANNMRWWVEQTSALDLDLPLVAGVSASIEPLIRPYYDAAPKQIDGLVVGLAGAVDYESKLDWQNGPAHIRLGGQLVGQVAVLVLVVLGMLIHGLSRGREEAA